MTASVALMTSIVAQAQVDKAKRDLLRTTVLAPIPGIVTNVDALQVGAAPAVADPSVEGLTAELPHAADRFSTTGTKKRKRRYRTGRHPHMTATAVSSRSR